MDKRKNLVLEGTAFDIEDYAIDNMPDRTDAKILIVDDRTENLIALEAVLESLGCTIVRATSGSDALKKLLVDDYAAILLDVQMPGMDGFETASLIKERERSRFIPIIFVTALSTELRHQYRGYSTGAVDYISKPFDGEILKSKVTVFVDLYLKEQMIREQAALIRQNDQREAELAAREMQARLEEQHMRDVNRRVRAFLKDVLSSVTEGRLELCESEDELPVPLERSLGKLSLIPVGAIRDLRVVVQEACVEAGLDDLRALDFVTAISEAAMNAVVHGAQGTAETTYDPHGCVQVRIRDSGGGIAVEDIPRATLERGYTTAGTMGHGFWIILKTADRIYMVTGPEGTTIVVEQERSTPQAPWLRD